MGLLEIPTLRWTTYDAAYFGVKLPEQVPPTQPQRVDMSQCGAMSGNAFSTNL